MDAKLKDLLSKPFFFMCVFLTMTGDRILTRFFGGDGLGGAMDPKTTFTGRTPYQPMKFKNRQEGTGLIAGLAKAYNTAERILGGDSFIKQHANNMATLKDWGGRTKAWATSQADNFMANGGILGTGAKMTTFIPKKIFGLDPYKQNKETTAFAKGQDYMPSSLSWGR